MSGRQWAVVTAVAVAAVAAGVAVYIFNPEETWWMPRCPFRALTGLDCPSCGSTRAMHCFLHGRVADGLRYNWFVAVSWPMAAFVAMYEGLRGRGARRPRVYVAAIYGYVALYVAWWVARNVMGV